MLLLDGCNHTAAAEFLLVVEHVVYTTLVVGNELVGIDAEFVDEDLYADVEQSTGHC